MSAIIKFESQFFKQHSDKLSLEVETIPGYVSTDGLFTRIRKVFFERKEVTNILAVKLDVAKLTFEEKTLIRKLYNEWLINIKPTLVTLIDNDPIVSITENLADGYVKLKLSYYSRPMLLSNFKVKVAKIILEKMDSSCKAAEGKL